MTPDLLAQGLLYYIVFLFSTTLHEAAHAWAAMRGGDFTAYHGGQVSIDPTPHIRREPFGMLILPLITTLTSGWPYGFASAPYDPRWAMRYPRRAGWMAIAGPAANLLLVVAAIIVIRVGLFAGVFYAPDSAGFGRLVATDAGGVWPGLAALTSAVFSMNLLLATLNLIPLPPLDGSGAILLFMNESTANRYQELIWTSPALGMVGMLAAWQLVDRVFAPVFWAFVHITYPGAGYG
ncbi:MAG: site-2 protease family protein [Vicinamibacterales bacterium]